MPVFRETPDFAGAITVMAKDAIPERVGGKDLRARVDSFESDFNHQLGCLTVTHWQLPNSAERLLL
jgi:hypothetical protein